MATGRSLKNEIPARNAQHFLDRDRTSRGIFPKIYISSKKNGATDGAKEWKTRQKTKFFVHDRTSCAFLGPRQDVARDFPER